MAIDEINAKGGIAGKWKITLTLQDNRSEAAQSAVVAQDLISKNVKFLICTSDADPCTAAGQIAQKAGIPTMSTAATSPTLPASVGDFMFMSVFGDNTQTTALADYAIEQGYRNAYLLCSPDSSYTSKSCDYFSKVLRRAARSLAGSFTLGAADFGAEVQDQNLAAARRGRDTTTRCANVRKQLRAARVTIPVSIDGVDTQNTIARADRPSGCLHVARLPGEGTRRTSGRRTRRSTARRPTVFAATGYDLVKIVEAGVTAAGSTDPKKVRDAIDNLENVKGATGTISFKGQNRIPLKTVYLIQVKDGAFHLLKTVQPDAADIPAP
jgi:branched-chain amino acid transport system substrate-binding protein